MRGGGIKGMCKPYFAFSIPSCWVPQDGAFLIPPCSRNPKMAGVM